MKKLILLLTLLFAVGGLASGQEADLILDKGVKRHPGIDRIYADFSTAYRKFDLALVSGLYTSDANYSAPGNPMTDGRDAIEKNFSGFFDYVKTSGNTMEIKFRITSRDVDGRIGYESGVYTINTFKDGKQVQTSRGRFFVVTKKLAGKWYFRFDGYSALKPE